MKEQFKGKLRIKRGSSSPGGGNPILGIIFSIVFILFIIVSKVVSFWTIIGLIVGIFLLVSSIRAYQKPTPK